MSWRRKPPVKPLFSPPDRVAVPSRVANGAHLHELRVVPALALVVEEGHVGHEVACALAAELVVEAGRDLLVVAVAADDVAHLVDRVVAVAGRRRVGVLGHLGADRPLGVLGQVVHGHRVEHRVVPCAHPREDLALDRRRRAAEDRGGRRAAGDALEAASMQLPLVGAVPWKALAARPCQSATIPGTARMSPLTPCRLPARPRNVWAASRTAPGSPSGTVIPANDSAMDQPARMAVSSTYV
jgi:hypothetical protein